MTSYFFCAETKLAEYANSVEPDEVTQLRLHSVAFRLDFTSKLVYGLTFGTPKFYIAPYDKINHGLVNLSSNCDVKSGLSLLILNMIYGNFSDVNFVVCSLALKG